MACHEPPIPFTSFRYRASERKINILRIA